MAEKNEREELIREKVNAGLSRQDAIEVIERQEAEDAEKAKAAKAAKGKPEKDDDKK